MARYDRGPLSPTSCRIPFLPRQSPNVLLSTTRPRPSPPNFLQADARPDRTRTRNEIATKFHILQETKLQRKSRTDREHETTERVSPSPPVLHAALAAVCHTIPHLVASKPVSVSARLSYNVLFPIVRPRPSPPVPARVRTSASHLTTHVPPVPSGVQGNRNVAPLAFFLLAFFGWPTARRFNFGARLAFSLRLEATDFRFNFVACVWSPFAPRCCCVSCPSMRPSLFFLFSSVPPSSIPHRVLKGSPVPARPRPSRRAPARRRPSRVTVLFSVILRSPPPPLQSADTTKKTKRTSSRRPLRP